MDPFRVEGYAIVSADGMIADAAGHMPSALVNPADQRFFAERLDRADLVVHGRHSHERQRGADQRRRLVLSRRAPNLSPHPVHPLAWFWNPAESSLADACAALGLARGMVAVIGGTEVYGLFLPRYDAFHLSTARRVHIPGGRPVFPGIPPATPQELLQRHGLHLQTEQLLDAAAEVALATWLRA